MPNTARLPPPYKSSRGRNLVIKRSGLQFCTAEKSSPQHMVDGKTTLAEMPCLCLYETSFSQSDRLTPGSWSAGGGFGFGVECANHAFGKAIKKGDSWAGRLGPPENPWGLCSVSDKSIKALLT